MELRDHAGVDILLGDGHQPQVEHLGVEEGGAGNVGHINLDPQHKHLRVVSGAQF